MHPIEEHRIEDRAQERGFILLMAMIATLIPLFLIIGATTQTMVARQSRLRFEIEDERSFAAAESGIDYCLYRASSSLGLTTNTTYTRDLGNGMTFTVESKYLKTDGIDNDSDGLTDAADASEDLYKLISSGIYRGKQRRLVAYLGPVPNIQPVTGAMSLESSLQIQVEDSARITGVDTNMDDTLGPGPNVPGISPEAPTTVASVLSVIDADDELRILGSTPAPSVVQTATALDWNANKTIIQNTANLVLTGESYTNWGGGTYTAGHGPNGVWKIIYRNGKVQFQGNSRGAGLMYINGDLQAQENFRFDGIIYCNGKVQLQGTARVYGAVFCNDSDQIQLQVSAKICYSSQAIAGASTVLPGKYVAFNGWQEISRN